MNKNQNEMNFKFSEIKFEGHMRFTSEQVNLINGLVQTRLEKVKETMPGSFLIDAYQEILDIIKRGYEEEGRA